MLLRLENKDNEINELRYQLGRSENQLKMLEENYESDLRAQTGLNKDYDNLKGQVGIVNVENENLKGKIREMQN